MRAGWQCPSCQGGASWNVRREGGSALETSICAACGYTAWYSGAAGQLEMQRVFNEHYRCLECGGDELHVEGTSDEADAAARLGARLGMAVVICACGRCDWMRAAGGHLDLVEPVERGSHDTRSCARCLGNNGFRIDAVCDGAGQLLPVAVVDGAAVGSFELRWCGSCSRCEWFARDLETLRADGNQVIFMEGETRSSAPVAGGPYR